LRNDDRLKDGYIPLELKIGKGIPGMILYPSGFPDISGVAFEDIWYGIE
jgi:hypothetical protein